MSDIRFNSDGFAMFDINMIGGTTQTTYLGTFEVYPILSPTQFLSAGRRYRELLGPNPAFATEFELNLAYALSQLELRVRVAPSFWNRGDIKDTEVIMAVFDKTIEVEEIFRKEQKEKTAHALETLKLQLEKIKSQNQSEESAEDEYED